MRKHSRASFFFSTTPPRDGLNWFHLKHPQSLESHSGGQSQTGLVLQKLCSFQIAFKKGERPSQQTMVV
jgi:hypothetical protein